MKVSVIIPTLNESKGLAHTLDHLLPFDTHEIILGDGGSTDGTQEIAARHPVRVVPGTRGRGAQMNAAAATASGDLFLFLHADSRVDPAGYRNMLRVMENGHLLGGAFSLLIDSPRPALRLVSRMATWRARFLNLVYGDQAFFVRAGVFRELGGFPPLPICEDLEFFRQLSRRGPVVILPEKTSTSSRRWEADGIAFTTFRNLVIAGAFLIGFPPRLLSRWRPPRR
ncbi:MAG: TIGR04283 family arsenosugar biosynthesis glycosyltransferase [Nitrospinaceae bacterium]